MEHLKVSSIGALTGLVALVTGGGTGVGLIIAKGYVANGARVYITGRREEVLLTAAAQVQGLVPLQMDVNDKGSIDQAVKTIQAKEGKLDILINNAGVNGPRNILEDDNPSGKTYGDFMFTKESFGEWEQVFSTNTSAPFFVTMAFLGLLEQGAKQRPGETSSVINVSSAAAISKLSVNTYAYVVSKAGLEHLTKVLATEFARREIPVRVNTLCLGTFPSEMTASEEFLQQHGSTVWPGTIAPSPLRRPGREKEAIMAAVYLGSSAGGYSNGGSLLADGGWSAVNL